MAVCTGSIVNTHVLRLTSIVTASLSRMYIALGLPRWSSVLKISNGPPVDIFTCLSIPYHSPSSSRRQINALRQNLVLLNQPYISHPRNTHTVGVATSTVILLNPTVPSSSITSQLLSE